MCISEENGRQVTRLQSGFRWKYAGRGQWGAGSESADSKGCRDNALHLRRRDIEREHPAEDRRLPYGRKRGIVQREAVGAHHTAFSYDPTVEQMEARAAMRAAVPVINDRADYHLEIGKDVSAEVINIHTIKPFDKELVVASAKRPEK